MTAAIWCLLLTAVTSVEGLRNLAHGKPAEQSTTDNGAIASRAVDGNTNSSLADGSCSTTLLETLVWWQVDLGRHYMVYRIKITSNMNSTQLNNMHVEISADYNNGIEFRIGHNQAASDGVLDISRPDGVKGRYVYLAIDLTTVPALTVLTLCEVEVYGAVEQYFQMERKRGASKELLHHVTRSNMECGLNCLWKDICRSFLWNPANKECILYSDLPTVTSSPDSMVGFASA